MKYLFDTDHVSILQNRTGPEFERLSARIALCDWADIQISIVSFHEQSLGVNAYINRATTLEDIERGYRFFDTLLETYCSANVMTFDTAAIAKADELRSRKIRVATMDLRIAAIAIANSLRLVTRNRRDFGKISELTIEDWTL